MGRSTIKQQSQRVLGMKPFFPSYNNPNLFLPKKKKNPNLDLKKKIKGPNPQEPCAILALCLG